jgi:hypothetical protein
VDDQFDKYEALEGWADMISCVAVAPIEFRLLVSAPTAVSIEAGAQLTDGLNLRDALCGELGQRFEVARVSRRRDCHEHAGGLVADIGCYAGRSGG